MKNSIMWLAAVAAAGGLAAPALAQYYPPQQAYPQTYPQTAYPQQAYPQYPAPQTAYGYPGQPAYGYQQGYNQNPISQIINQLLGTGNRYTVTDRTAVERCATAAMTQAQRQYPSSAYRQGYGYQQGYNQGYGAAGAMRVTAITDVQRRNNGLRVAGTLSSGYGTGYGAYGNQAYGAADLSFRCNVAYNGAVTNIRLGRAMAYRR